MNGAVCFPVQNHLNKMIARHPTQCQRWILATKDAFNTGLTTIFISAYRNKQAKGQTKTLFVISSILNDKIDKNKKYNHFNTGLYMSLNIYSQCLNLLFNMIPLGECVLRVKYPVFS